MTLTPLKFDPSLDTGSLIALILKKELLTHWLITRASGQAVTIEVICKGIKSILTLTEALEFTVGLAYFS